MFWRRSWRKGKRERTEATTWGSMSAVRMVSGEARSGAVVPAVVVPAARVSPVGEIMAESPL